MADITTRFREVESRVRDLVADNKRLRSRVRELESELAGLRADMQEFGKYQRQRGEVRERLERILAQLESLKSGELRTDEGGAQDG